MAAMMVPTAAPFFFVYGRDTRRPAAVLITVLIYVAVWAAIGAIAGVAMGPTNHPRALRDTLRANGVLERATDHRRSRGKQDRWR